MSASAMNDRRSAPGRDAELRAERVAKYKEERRRQLAGGYSDRHPTTNTATATTTTTTTTTSAQTCPQQTSTSRRFITRAKNSSANSAVGDAVVTTTSGRQAGPDVNFGTESVTVRTTRASRLRAAKAGNMENTTNRRQSASSTVTTTSDHKDRSPVSLALSVAADSSSAPSRLTRSEKDKSSKRKSNLNRALNTEEAPSLDGNNENPVRRRRRRVLNANDILTSLNESGLSSGSAHTSARVTPLPSPSSPNHLSSSRTISSTSTPSSRKSDLSIHMENARRGVTADASTRSGASSRRVHLPSPKQKTDTDRRRSTASEQEDTSQSNSEKDLRKKIIDETKTRRAFSSDEKVAKSKRLSGDFDKADKSKQGADELVNGRRRINGDRNSKKVLVNSASRNIDVTKRMDELAALTRETLARVERLTHRSQHSPRKELLDSRKKSASKSPEKVLRNTRLANESKQLASERVNGNILNTAVDLDYQNHNGYHNEIMKPSSILKKKSLDDSVVNMPPPSVQVQLPVSILKRKSSQDEAGFSTAASSFPTPPVTFSPTVVDPVAIRKKPGILKKRCSLDENQVIRRRSYSPEVALVQSSNDYKPILKNQRRSSLEEIIRTRSPDYQPQGILKRKHSRGEDEFGARSLGSPEPQSILKRRSGTSSSGSSGNSPHVSIATAVILAAAGGAEIILEPSEPVRPILKKKSISDENQNMDSLNPEIPKPILKKKSSTETDDQDDRPMRPILKTSKKCSQDESSREFNEYSIDSPRIHSMLRNRSNHNSGESGSECETVRPILKQTSSRENSPRPRLSFCNDEDDVTLLNRSSCAKSPEGLLRRPKSVRRSHTVADADLSSIINLKSFEQAPEKEEESPVNEENQLIKRPVSVFEMIMNFEKSNGGGPSTGAIPKRSSLKGSRNSGRFRTQPITFDELEATASLESIQSFQLKVEQAENRTSPVRSESQCSPNHRDQNDNGDLSHSLDLTCSTLSSSSQNNDSQLTTPSSVPNESADSGVASKMSFAMDDDLSREDGDAPSEKDIQSPQELCRSNSVSAKASMFKQLEAHMKAVAEEAKSVRLAKGSNQGIQRYRNRKQVSTSASEPRFATQPITLDEVQEAVRANQRASEISEQDTVTAVSNTEGPDPSKLSLAERVKLFNQKITEERLPVAPGGGPSGGIIRKPRHARFKTQPVTNEEMQTVQRISPLVASLVKPPEADALEGLSIRATKDKIYEHAAKMLTSEVKGILKSKSVISPVPTYSSSGESNVRKPLKTILKKDSYSAGTNGLHKSESSEDEGVSSDEISSASESNKNGFKLHKESYGSIKSEKWDSCIKEIDKTCKIRKKLEETQHMSSSTEGTSDAESSGGREVKRIIANEAVARRRQAAINRQKEKNSIQLVKSKSQSSIGRAQVTGRSSLHSKSVCLESEQSAVDEFLPVGFVRGGVRRSLTLPLRGAGGADMPGGGTIADRLAELQHSGNNEWRKRLPKLNNTNDELIELNNIVTKNLYNDSLSADADSVEKTSILAVRKDKLDAAAQEWKKRVEVSDAASFSVAGRMYLDVNELPISPLVVATSGEKKKRVPKASKFRSKEGVANISSTPVSPQKEEQIKFKRSVSAPGVGDEENESDSESPVSKMERRCVHVPRPDDETFTTFFESITKSQTVSEHLEITEEDLDSVTRQSGDLLVTKRTVRAQRKHIGTARNPIKALAARSDIKEEYTEIITGVAEREKRRMNVEKLAQSSSMAVEALAGLASKEDFTAISLKKGSANLNMSFLPYKDLMLLHIKGRRHVQTRLVEPVASSINMGDNYVLVTPNQVYNYVGLYSNVIEQSRGAEVAQHIFQKKDLGCKCNEIITIHEKKGICTKPQLETFWNLLGSTPEEIVVEAGHPDEDEIYESAIIDTNMVYELNGDELVPVEEYWGSIPKIEMLDSSKVFVFDFGSEMYIWSGRNAAVEKRKIATKLAKELWNIGYNYSDCAICPFNAVLLLGDRTGVSLEKTCNFRPDWALLGKISQHGETILFREKFLDWPDFSRVIKVKNNDPEKQVDGSILVKPCNTEAMLKPNTTQPDLLLEGSHLGRGVQFFDDETSRHFEISTLDVTVWHILEYEYEQLEDEFLGQFYNGDSYVIRWQYMVTMTGRELSGKPSKHAVIGRDRCAYFCWQGKYASLNEKGAAALLTVELDHERGPQIRVSQGSEHPAFLNLFNGFMIINMGRRKNVEQQESPWKLYMCRGEMENEAHLLEVPCNMRQLRSRTSFILLNKEKDFIFLWYGNRTFAVTRNIALSLAKKIKVQKSKTFGFCQNENINIREVEEGKENSEFLEALGGNRQLYVSLVNDSNIYNHTLRLFHLSSVSGVFKANELFCPHQSEHTTPYPFLQNELYSASQPALFLIDNNHELWLWQGWWPEIDSDSDSDSDRLHSDQTGSGQHRWQAERRAAMQTALDYWSGTRNKPVTAYLVWAGLEPLEFTNLFPTWTDRDDIAELIIKDGRKPGEILMVENELARLTQSTYPLSQLLQRPLPEGVDPTHLEDYLSTEDFVCLLGMSKPDFLRLPTWRQTNIKKENGLF